MADGDAIFTMSLTARQRLFHQHKEDDRTVQLTIRRLHQTNRSFHIPEAPLFRASPVLEKYFRRNPRPTNKIYDLGQRSIQQLRAWILDLKTMSNTELAQSAPGIRANTLIDQLSFLDCVDLYELCSSAGMPLCTTKLLTIILNRIHTTGVTVPEARAICRTIPRRNIHTKMRCPWSNTSFNNIVFIATEKITAAYHQWPAAHVSMSRAEHILFEQIPASEKRIHQMIEHHENMHCIHGQGYQRYPIRGTTLNAGMIVAGLR